MTDMTLGKMIAQLRKDHRITQEELSEKLGVSPQAVSKWENDQSYPDILLLPKIAEIFRVSIDELFSRSAKPETMMLTEAEKKPLDDMIFKVIVNAANGDKVRVNLPMPLIKVGLEIGMKMPEVAGNDALQGIDLGQLFTLVEKGVIGKLVEVESSNGDSVQVFVE